MARLLISAAHTLENPGEIFQDLREADLTRNLLKKVVPHLEALNIDFQPVPLDLPLLQRIEWINNTGFTEEAGDIFIELHVNDGGKRGVESWFRGAAGDDNQSQKLAEEVTEGICKKTGYTKQGVKSEYDHELGSLLILNQINPIGTAIECLYIDNEEDIKILKDDAKMEELAKIIAESIQDYVKNVKPIVKTKDESFDNAQDDKKTENDTFLNSSPSLPSPLPSFGGSSSSFPSFGGPSTPSFSSPSPFNKPAGKSSSLVMDRKERETMVKNTYQKILGKEPNQNDLNYYLNLGTSEEDLVKKLLDLPEFKTLVENAGKVKDLESKIQTLEIELTQTKGSFSDQKKMLDSLNNLLAYKNQLIARLKQLLAQHNIVPEGQHIDTKQPEPPKSKTPNAPRPTSATQRIMKVLKI